jgi:hypothetical protein
LALEADALFPDCAALFGFDWLDFEAAEVFGLRAEPCPDRLASPD